MDFLFLKHLSKDQINQIDLLFHRVDFSSIEQYPGFSEAAYPKEKTVHALLVSHNTIKGYAQIKIKKRLLASVYFGPIVENEHDYSNFIKEIKRYCKKKFIPLLKVFPPAFTKKYSESFWEKLKKETGFQTSEKDFNWASLVSKIDSTDEELLKSFGDNHRQSIKKALKLELNTEILKLEEVEDFNNQFCELYKKRGIDISIAENLQKFTNLFHFFENNSKGFFMGVKQKNILIGGVCISHGNNVSFYLEGYSHPNYRKLPISHLVIYEAMKLSRDKGYNYFDFGGYALNTNKGDQLYNINQFKESFKGKLIRYPKTMTFYAFLPVKWIYNLILRK